MASNLKIYSQSIKEADSFIKGKKISVGVVGFGYIGSCIGSVLADRGINVVAIDTNSKLIEEVKKGTISIHEPGLKELISKTVKSGKLKATSESKYEVNESGLVLKNQYFYKGKAGQETIFEYTKFE